MFLTEKLGLATFHHCGNNLYIVGMYKTDWSLML